LEAGESALFPAGELEITAMAPSAQGGTRALVAGMTSSLQTGGAGAAYVVSVIGPEIPPPPTPTATATAVPPTPVPTETPAPQLGSIGLLVYGCPPGMSVENMVGDICQVTTDGLSFTLSGPAGVLTLADAGFDGGAFTWGGLPLGIYTLEQSPLPRGFTSYFVPGSAAVGGLPDGGYSVAIDETAPDIMLQVYNFQPATTGSISAFTYLCPGVAPEDVAPESCDGSPVGLVVIPLAGGDRIPGSPTADGALWADLPFGDFQILPSAIPEGYFGFVSGGQLYTARQGGPVVSISTAQPSAAVELYFVAPFVE
jgi:hypothetical protein